MWQAAKRCSRFATLAARTAELPEAESLNAMLASSVRALVSLPPVAVAPVRWKTFTDNVYLPAADASERSRCSGELVQPGLFERLELADEIKAHEHVHIGDGRARHDGNVTRRPVDHHGSETGPAAILF